MSAGRPSPMDRKQFPELRDIPTRWMDVDIYGHVNNVQYLSFFDTAVNSWYVERKLLDPRSSETIFLVVETSCHYFAELVFPETLTAGLRVEKLGSSSVVYTIALFKEGEATAAAQGRYVHVLVDRKSRRPMPISTEMREILAALVPG